MSWELKIKDQLAEATKNYAISSTLKKLAKELLKGGNEFELIFSSSRQEYVNLRLKEKPTKETLKIASKFSNINVVKSLIKNNRLY